MFLCLLKGRVVWYVWVLKNEVLGSLSLEKKELEELSWIKVGADVLTRSVVVKIVLSENEGLLLLLSVSVGSLVISVWLWDKLLLVISESFVDISGVGGIESVGLVVFITEEKSVSADLNSLRSLFFPGGISVWVFSMFLRICP